jgi:hypothetical protein
VLSDLIDVLGLAALVAGAFVLLGLGWALLVLCPVLMFLARAVEGDGDAAAHRALTRVLAGARRAVTAPARVKRPRRRKPQAA